MAWTDFFTPTGAQPAFRSSTSRSTQPPRATNADSASASFASSAPVAITIFAPDATAASAASKTRPDGITALTGEAFVAGDGGFSCICLSHVSTSLSGR